MNHIIRGPEATILELGPSYESLDQAALLEFGGLVLSEAIHCEPPRLILDLSQTTYIGSSFIEVLVRAWKRLRQRNGNLVLCGLQPFCAEVLRISRLDSLWPICATREDALTRLTDLVPHRL
jgi:anti-anti-sigma factor